jgi:hypothetical protein
MQHTSSFWPANRGNHISLRANRDLSPDMAHHIQESHKAKHFPVRIIIPYLPSEVGLSKIFLYPIKAFSRGGIEEKKLSIS